MKQRISDSRIYIFLIIKVALYDDKLTEEVLPYCAASMGGAKI